MKLELTIKLDISLATRSCCSYARTLARTELAGKDRIMMQCNHAFGISRSSRGGQSVPAPDPSYVTPHSRIGNHQRKSPIGEKKIQAIP
jgi:hypothetical protein